MWLFAGGISGALAVGMGAFGAHGLKSKLSELEDFTTRMGWWLTAADYHLAHSLLLVLIGLLALNERAPTGPLKVAGIATLIGIALFSGSLYTMTLTGVRVLGAVTPFGGTAFLVAWGALAYAGFQMRG